jgi:hypothetical protein
MKGSISIDNLIFVVIGIIVLVVVLYLMFLYSKKSSFNCGLCRAKFAEWCQRCAISKYNWNSSSWPDNIEKDEILKKCIQGCMNSSPDDTCNLLREKCKGYLPNITGVF